MHPQGFWLPGKSTALGPYTGGVAGTKRRLWPESSSQKTVSLQITLTDIQMISSTTSWPTICMRSEIHQTYQKTPQGETVATSCPAIDYLTTSIQDSPPHQE